MTTTHISDDNPSNENILIQPLLSYVLFSLQNSTVDNVRNAVLGHFSEDAVIDAKNSLWANSDSTIIGEKPRRKDSVARSEKEAHTQDIINALVKLDKAEKMPTIVIDALSLGIIPRSHPEELNNISLVDRLNRLEAKFTALQVIVDKTVCENISLKEKIENNRSYADVVSNNIQQGASTNSNRIVIDNSSIQEMTKTSTNRITNGNQGLSQLPKIGHAPRKSNQKETTLNRGFSASRTSLHSNASGKWFGSYLDANINHPFDSLRRVFCTQGSSQKANEDYSKEICHRF